ncbi:hypothetical protein FBU59_003768 [Linderina macrospora]|uniref:Uncharacterized protein n=1 Tax=Linderina macrospora TaxID=4868 RepID=A0ACC1J7P6_9FUNG|nr:hypothetical protein FBU59_003768 [Linderina macrospora]
MRDYRTPAKSQVLTPPWAGGNGQENNCVMDGAQANWQMTFPDRHCLQRVFSNGGDIDPWYSPEYIQSFIQRDTTMEEFRPDIEFSIHGIVHVDISGDMSTTYSCNDILFWLHHSNIDRIWWEWQNVPSANGTLSNMWKMGGPNYDNTETTIYTDIVAYNEPISTVMQLGYGMMCYQYTDAFYPVSNIARSANVSESAYTVVRDDATLISYVASALRNKKEIPYPARLTPEWIAMHKFNVSDVNHVENDARQFVEEMFMAGYKSPI